MIHITNIRNMKPETHDYAYVIVRSLKYPVRHAEQLTALSPSTTIFWEFLRKQKTGQWNQNTFDEWYAPAFLSQIANDDDAKEVLQELIRMDKQGKDIVLSCFCSNPVLCHRTIIASVLAENGARVMPDAPIKNYGFRL